ncbi:MAG TPA: cytochrome c maturation protein CcmE [Cyclobacteriaceae bacterium]|nr:cytochrome c maturation protein CcmE [Cyclobacteriaceae bacterium]
MKKSHIIAIVVIAAAIGIIVSTAGDASSYVTFDQAYQMSAVGNKNSIHVVGELKKNALGEITGMEKSPDNLSFSFVLIDENKKEQKVYYNEPMPPDFTRSEKVVVIGSYHGDIFVAEKILLKCPSKYQEQSLNPRLNAKV